MFDVWKDSYFTEKASVKNALNDFKIDILNTYIYIERERDIDIDI